MILGIAATLAILVLTLGWIIYDLSRSLRRIPPMSPLILGNGKTDWKAVEEAERLFNEKRAELDEVRQKAGIFKSLCVTGDEIASGSDTAVVRSIDMKIEIARQMALRKKA